mmetsp:Transcript_24788/g.58820  ORF Transcript_24788/g.58820 Transcript_24788/m.58820 type:complete len:221 (+) Transcript_24788:657-1319(+)
MRLVIRLRQAAFLSSLPRWSLVAYPPGVDEHPLALLALGLLALRVGQPRAGLLEHLDLVLVHVHRVGPGGLRLGVRVDLARPELARLARAAGQAVPPGGGPGPGPRAAVRRRGLVQEALVALLALARRPPHERPDGAPLRRHQLGQVQELLVLLPAPLHLAHGRVQPLVPPRLALLRGLAVQQGRHAGPLLLPVLHHRGLEDLILGVLPHASLDEHADHA